MNTVYICSADKRDIEKAILYTQYALSRGVTPVTPHFLSLCSIEGNFNMNGDIRISMLDLMRMCDEVWVFGEEGSNSIELREELIEADRRLKIPVFYIKQKDIETYLSNCKGGV